MGEWHKTGVVCAVLVAAGWACLYGVGPRFEADTPLQPRTPEAAAQPLVPCEQAAMMFHDVRWAASCMVVAEQDAQRLAACLQDPAIMADPRRGRDYCDHSYGSSDGSADCTLPEGPASRLNAWLSEAHSRCALEGRTLAVR